MAGLAQDQQRLAGEHVALGGQAVEEPGVLQRGLLQGRVRQGRGGLAQRRHGVRDSSGLTADLTSPANQLVIALLM